MIATKEEDLIETHRIEAQKRLEAEGVNRGIRAYREEVAKAALADTQPGLIIIRDAMVPLVRAITEKQEEARGIITNSGRGRPPPWIWPILALSPEKTALITLRSILTSDRRDTDTGARRRPVAHVALAIANAMRIEIEFDMWREAERQKSKAAKAEGDTTHRDMWEALRRSAKVIDQRAFASWGRKIKLIREQAWPKPLAVHIGTCLIHLAVQHCGGWFAVVNVWERGKSTGVVTLTAEAVAAIEEAHTRAELMMPALLPMVVPPAPWRLKGTH